MVIKMRTMATIDQTVAMNHHDDTVLMTHIIVIAIAMSHIGNQGEAMMNLFDIKKGWFQTEFSF